MRKAIYQLHIWLGMIVSIPLLAWCVSGLIYAVPNQVEGGKVGVIKRESFRIAPDEAMRRADEYAGKNLPTTALTLLVRDGRPVYQAIGGMGAESLLIDAETGEVIKTPAPNLATRFFRQAHFYYFAGGYQVPLLITMSALATLSVLSGIYLNIVFWRRKRSGKQKEIHV